ncbi:MAG: glycosyltransferase, partial [Vicinamibacteria bacterium]
MRILHVSSYFAPAFTYGGPPKSIFGLCKALQEIGIEIEVFTTTANGSGELSAASVRSGSYDGLPVRYFPLAWPRRFFATSGLKEALEARVESYDLVHVHGLWNVPGWLAAAASRRKSVPYLISPRGMLDRGSLAHHRIRKQVCFWLKEKQHLRGAALLHATSEAEKESILRFGLGPPVEFVPNGVSTPQEPIRGSFRPRWNLPESAPLVVYLGRIHRTKRIDLLLAAFERVRMTRANAVLVVAGREDGLSWSSLRPEATGEVRWLGEVGEEDKWALLSEASVLVLCSDSESYGLSVAEALSGGVPVVVTQSCPWREVGTRGCGMWVEHDAEAIAEGITTILGNPVEARRMGARGRELANEKYGWPSIAKQMKLHYEELLSTT